VLGRYVLYDQIGAGGMAVVHLARLTGPAGFSRAVAIKLLHGHLAHDPEFSSMFLDEARLAACIRHPNVVPTLDVTATDDQLFLVMELVNGEPLSRLLQAAQQAGEQVPIRIASAIMTGVLHGLHAAHEASSDGEPLGIVHRDVSPQNVLVGSDGVARVLDFGIAKAAGRSQTTRDGQIKGKASYMAPEQIRTEDVDARTDVYAAAVVLWEILAGKRLFVADSMEATINMVLERAVPPPSTLNPDIPAALDALVLRGAARDVRKRFASAREMAIELETLVPPATPREVGEWVGRIAGERLRQRASNIATIEATDLANETSVTVAEVGATPLTAPTVPLARKPVRRIRAGMYIAASVAALAVGLVSWRLVASGPATTAAAAASEPPAPAVASPSPPVVESPPAPATSPQPAPAAPPPPAASHHPKAPASTPPRKAAATDSCQQWYTVKNGIRIPKPECLNRKSR
jgi:serine/threonine-protein kinase